jgi:hypothetical protein
VTEDADSMGEGVVGFMTDHPDQCVSFYAVDDETGIASAPTQMTVHAPLPTETVSAEERLEPWGYPWWYAHVTGMAPGNHVGYAVMQGPCPTIAPEPDRWRTQRFGDLMTPGTDPPEDVLFPSQGAGANCALFTSLDWWGWNGSRVSQGVPVTMTDRHGPVVMREFVDEGPLQPTVGQPMWDAGRGAFTVPVSSTKNLEVSYDPDDPTACPGPGAAGAQTVSYETLDAGTVLVSPVASPYACLTFYARAYDGPVRMSPGQPVDFDVPQG